jgi:hypothetical protein
VLKQHPRRLPDGKFILIRRKGGLPLRADPETRHASRPVGDHARMKTVRVGTMQARPRKVRAEECPFFPASDPCGWYLSAA